MIKYIDNLAGYNKSIIVLVPIPKILLDPCILSLNYHRISFLSCTCIQAIHSNFERATM